MGRVRKRTIATADADATYGVNDADEFPDPGIRRRPNLAARGMRVDRSMLFVIDGSKAMAKAIRSVVGTKAIIQRCQVHKRRNVEDHLPEDMKKSVGRTISAAYTSDNAPRAKRMLEGLARQLEKKHPAAAASLREGLDETLTVLRFGLTPWLARSASLLVMSSASTREARPTRRPIS